MLSARLWRRLRRALRIEKTPNTYHELAECEFLDTDFAGVQVRTTGWEVDPLSRTCATNVTVKNPGFKEVIPVGTFSVYFVRRQSRLRVQRAYFLPEEPVWESLISGATAVIAGGLSTKCPACSRRDITQGAVTVAVHGDFRQACACPDCGFAWSAELDMPTRTANAAHDEFVRNTTVHHDDAAIFGPAFVPPADLGSML